MLRVTFLIIIFFLCLPVFNQISSPNSDFVAATNYISTEINDSVYVFYAGEDGESTGSLTAKWTGATNPCTFTWYSFNENTLGFDISLQTDNGSTSSVLGLEHGAYQVQITDAEGNDTSFTAFIFIDHFDVAIDKRPDESTLPGYRNCFQGRNILNLNVEVELDTLRYYDAGADKGERWILLINTVKETEWDAETDDQEFVESFRIGYYDDILLENPPVEDTDFFLTVTDRFGLQKKDHVFYETIHVRATIDTSFIYINNLEKPDYMAQYYEQDELSLPQQIQFNAEESSSKAGIFKWDFGNDSTSRDTIPDPVTYYEPKEYTVKLTVYNTDIPECYDIDSVTIDLTDVTPEFELPNVLIVGDHSPKEEFNGKTLTNKFRSYDVSVGYFEILIFNRYGRKVHSFEGYIRDWPGWDGSINNSDRKVSTGVYFYVFSLEREVQIGPYKVGEFSPTDYRTIKDQKAGSIHVFNNN